MTSIQWNSKSYVNKLWVSLWTRITKILQGPKGKFFIRPLKINIGSSFYLEMFFSPKSELTQKQYIIGNSESVQGFYHLYPWLSVKYLTNRGSATVKGKTHTHSETLQIVVKLSSQVTKFNSSSARHFKLLHFIDTCGPTTHT